MKNKETIIWIGLLVFILIHIQMNIHHVGWFLATAMLGGFIPVKNLNFLRFSFIELIALAVCFLLNIPKIEVLKTLGEIFPVGGVGFMLLTALISTLSFAIVANSTYQLIGRRIYKF